MIMLELMDELKTSVRWASRCPSCSCEMSIDNMVGRVTSTGRTWKNYPICFALLDVGFMILLRRADRYVLIWARSAVPTDLQLSPFSNIADLEQNLKNYFYIWTGPVRSIWIRTGRSLIVDSKEIRTKKTETDERSFCYREPFLCLCVSKIESFKGGGL